MAVSVKVVCSVVVAEASPVVCPVVASLAAVCPVVVSLAADSLAVDSNVGNNQYNNHI